MAQTTLDFPQLAKLIRRKRHSKGLREAAAEIGDISPSTLSRIEGERVRDLNVSTFLQICDWLDIAPGDLISTRETHRPPELDVVDSVNLQLRAKSKLDPKTVELLTQLVKTAVEQNNG